MKKSVFTFDHGVLTVVTKWKKKFLLIPEDAFDFRGLFKTQWNTYDGQFCENS